MMEISHNALQEQIPYYLTQPQKDGLKQALKDFETEGKSVPCYTGQNGETICARVEDIAAMGVDKAIEVMGSNACNTDTGQA